MKSKITLLLLTLFLCVSNSYSQFTSNYPDLRLCGSPPNYYLDVFNCDSNNFELDNVFLSLTNVNGQPLSNTTCTIGVTQQVYVMLNYTSNASNTPNNCRLFADLSIDGNVTGINAYLGSIAPGAGQRQIYGPFNWTCGQELILDRILVVWRTGGSSTQLSSYNCATYNSAQCEMPGMTVISKPLAVQFTYKACRVGNNTTVYFDSTTNGGIAPYTFAWDFDNNGTTDSTLENPIHVYTTLNNSAKLRVTDSQGLTNTYTLPIVSPTELMLSETHVNVSCGGGSNTGSIDLSATGGTPGYTYSWSNGATSQDLSGLSAGTYTVTVTDANGCQKTLPVTISGGDATNPVVNAPANTTIQGCNSSSLATAGLLAYSSSQTTITVAQFNQAGGSFTDASAISSITYQDTQTGSCPIVVTRTFRVTDVCNNVGTAVQTITIQDTTAPVFDALPAVSSVSCPATPSFAQASATDNCGGQVTLTFNDVTTNGACAGSYSVTRTWTATDACGNASTATQTINVTDTTAPVIAALPAPSTISCPATPEFAQATATDACGSGATLTFVDNTTNGACAGSYSVTRTWTATDACGNASTATQTINVTDTTAPVIAALPAPSTISCPATPEFAQATATDACGSGATLTFVDNTTNGACAGSYSVTRTWTATDACGNASTASQTINVQDTTAPVIAALPAPSTISCPATPEFAQATATDACGSGATLTFVDNTTNGACAGSYSVTRTWTATDACGNASTASQTINVQDTTAPVIAALPAPSTISCPATPEFAQATATDACGSGATLTFVDNTTNGACAGSYSVTRTWTATDACGNASTASQTINVTDTTAPVIAALPAPSTISCPATPEFAQATATDACGSGATLTFVDNTTNGACAGSYSVTRTWTATDACGNASTATQTINVTDTTAPVIAALPAPSTISCPATPEFAQATATDACGSGATLTFVDNTTNGACAGSYSVTRTWTATDACGNASTATQTINVTDTTAPVIAALPAPSTISCPATPEFAQATATDACGSGATLTFVDNTTNGACAGSYSVTRTWTATDACGNASTASQTINVQDTTAPVIAALPAPSTISCPATPEFAQATATDACGSGATLTFVDNTTNGACAGSYSVTRTWTATDACGNASTASQTINVTDTTAPVIAALPAPSTISCPATPEFAQATATDACGSGATLTFVDNTTNGACAGSYSVTRTWTATDACGNASTATQTITVQDTTAPVISSLPSTSTIDCPATPSFATPTASDACGSGVTLTFADTTTNGNCAGNYSVTRTWTAVDICGNTSTATQTVNVRDTTAPTFTVPANVTVNAGANCVADLNPGTTGSVTNIFDACDANPTVTYTDSDCFGNDNDASINAGNGNYFYFDVTGFDNLTAKDIEKVALSFETNQGKGRAEFTLVAPNGSAVILVGPYCTGGACEDPNSNDQELYLPVFYPNSSGYTQWNNNNVVTQDIPQNFTPNGALSSTNTIIGLTSYVSSFENLTGPMNGTWFIFSRKQASVNGSINFNSVCLTPLSICESNRVVTRTWTVTDECGNAASATQIINVRDVTAPVIAELPAVSTISCPATPEFAQATATDNCDPNVSLTFADVTTNGNCAGSYSVTRTWTATDACGNTSTASQTINVQDVTAPVIAELPAASTISCPATPEFAQATATDECGSAFELTFADVTTNGNCAGSYSVTRTWTATDACGNTSTASQTINVQDVTAPVIAELPAASTISCPATPEFAQATATDECGSAFELTFADVTTNGNCAGSYSVTRTWTATDACGNTSTASQTINVQDVTAPVIAELPAASTISCPATPEFAQATATDECGSAFELTFADVTTNGNCAGSYSVTRTWTATDACGNTSTASQTINVQDVTAPVIAELPAASTISCPATPEFAQATATDECGSAFELTFADVTTNGNCAGSYSVTRTWTATDACGNTSTASQTINVQDVTAPVIAELPAASTISCPASPEFAQATATDECGSAFELTFADVTTNGNCAGSYSVTRTWTATDACGNTSTASQTINVQDVTAPVIAELPAASTISCPATPEFAQATATDECGSAFELTFADVTTNGNCAGSYSVTRTWTATDACGNTSTASQTINVQDVTAPVIAELPAASTISCPATPEFAQATATDECGSAFELTFADVTTNGNCAGSYSVTRTWTATDACGNTSTASQTINVQDVTAPVIAELPAASTISCPATPEFAQATATDECGSAFELTFADVTTNGNCAGSYSVTRTWTATDACGNTSTASQTINVQDVTAPVIAELPAASTISCPATPEFAQATATDECGSAFELTFADVTTNGNCAGSYSVTRTWTATDACGNTSTASQTINVQDVTAPVIAELPAASTISCPATPEFAQATATDECGSAFELTFADVTTNGNCAGSYSVTRTWTATDACGNTSTASQTINVQDVTAPVITSQASNIIVECDGNGNELALYTWLTNNGGATATDECSPVIWSNNFSEIANDCSAAVNVVFTATDECGNTATTSATFTINDTQNPIAPEAPANVTVACVADVPANVSLTATDNCSNEITAQGVDAVTQGNCPNSFSVTRTWTFTDACGNSSSVSQIITVNDTIAPVAPEAPANVTVACASDVPAMISLTANDNCGDSITVEGVDAVTQGNCPNSFSVTRTWTFTDACGNSSSVSQIITVNDTIAPVAPEAPANVTVACASDVPAMISLTANDNCGDSITVEGVDAVTQGNCPNSFSVTRTWTFTDACGNSSSVSQIITVNDTIAPVAPEAPANVTVACASDVPAMISLTANDNCGDSITVEGVDAVTQGNCPNSFSVTRTWTFTDACGNSSSVSQIITVNDTIAPVAPEAPANVTVACIGEVPAMISLTANDNCGEFITVEGVDSTVQGDCPNSFVVTRTWTFTDACGNSSSVSQTISVVDETAPVAPEAPANVTVACASDVPAMISLTANDNCGDSITVEGVDAVTQGNCPNSFSVTRTWTFTDACGNSSSVSQIITVNDTIAPVAPEAPANVTVACIGEVPAMISLTANDNCGEFITVEGVDSTVQGDCPNSFVVTRTWTFTDACGNSSSVSQTISVVDETAPVAPEAPANVTVACAGDVPATVSLTAVDNCGESITVEGVDTTNQGNCPNSFVVTRTWTFTDVCGNTSSVSQTITVNDTVNPTFNEVAPANTTASCDNIPTAAVLTATDNCGTATVTMVETITQGNCPSNYLITRTWTATDACGNTSIQTQTIGVSDTVGPVLASELQVKIDVICSEIPDAPTLTFTDNCSTVGTPVFTETQSEPVNGTYTITRSWVVSDACGNLSQTYYQYVFVDQIAEVINLDDLTLNNFDNQNTFLDGLLPAGVTGGTWTNVNNVGGFNATNNTFNPFEIEIGEYLFTYTVNDGPCPTTYNLLIRIGGVGPCEAIIIHNAFTPNGDAFNQYFNIENIEDIACYPTNNVQIYNRWGVLVYETKNYDNNTRRFEGISEGRVTVSKSEELPTGTYFYIIEWTTSEGTKVTKDGYLYLTR